ncbi:MAG: response regulator [Methylococcaceae bacterium]|nr:response regulator [Methylococcaceae bacterium]
MANPKETINRGEILIVDDSAENRKLLCDLLTEANYTVRQAPDGELALMTCFVRPPELMLLDIRMPGMDGYEVCRRLKADPRTRDVVPIIFVSALREIEDKVQGFRAGAVDFITKPFHSEEVLARVNTHVSLARARKELEMARAHLEERVQQRTVQLQQEVAERQRAEEEVRRLNQQLEQRVLERTAELEAANKSLEAFAYSVSHDLRAPLRHIAGFTGLLRKKLQSSLDEQSAHYLDTIAEVVQRMATLIDDLLAFSRLGRNEMRKIRIDLSALLQEVIRDFDQETKGRVIDWRIAELPAVIGDRPMLRMVLVNLVSNALKFTQPRAVAEIEIGCLPAKENETVLFVRDNGVGFDMNYADKLFGVFQRLHGADEFEGTGIGLANVRRIIGRHGGKTWAEGKVDGGATVYFTLPRSEPTV